MNDKVFLLLAYDVPVGVFKTMEDARACVASLKSMRANDKVEYSIRPLTYFTEWR